MGQSAKDQHEHHVPEIVTILARRCNYFVLLLHSYVPQNVTATVVYFAHMFVIINEKVI